MTDTDLKKLTLASAHQMLAQRKISSEELLEAVLSRIERLNAEFRAFITVSAHKPLQASGTLPLQGLPLSVKDLFDTKGVRTTAGSKIYADRVPQESAAVVDRLEEA